MIENPFRNVLATYDLLPAKLQPLLISNVMFDWSDLVHNANPIEHVAATSPDDALAYLDEWHYEPEWPHPEHHRQLLVDLAACLDRIAPLLPPDDETTFAGEHVASGQYLAIDECEFPDYEPESWESFDDYTIVLVIADPSWEPDPIAAPDGLNADDDPYIRHTFHLVNHTIEEG